MGCRSSSSSTNSMSWSASRTTSWCSTTARRSPRARPTWCGATRRSSAPISAEALRWGAPRLPELLTFRAVDTYYGDLHVLKGVDYRIDAGEIVSLLGGNASGKSTTMKAIMGVVVPTRGEIIYEGQSLSGVSIAERVRRGIAPVLEARRLFPRMTVYENLEMGAYTRARGPEFDEDLQRVFSLFPRVEERLKQLAGP